VPARNAARRAQDQREDHDAADSVSPVTTKVK